MPYSINCVEIMWLFIVIMIAFVMLLTFLVRTTHMSYIAKRAKKSAREKLRFLFLVFMVMLAVCMIGTSDDDSASDYVPSLDDGENVVVLGDTPVVPIDGIIKVTDEMQSHSLISIGTYGMGYSNDDDGYTTYDVDTAFWNTWMMDLDALLNETWNLSNNLTIS